jgi:hypothetical protein
MRRYLVARVCTLAPGSVDDPAQPERLSAAELLGSPTAYWALTERAALRFRAGRFREAVWLAKASLLEDGRPGRAVLNWLWLALAYEKLGKTDEARRCLGKAAGWLDQQKGRMPLDTPAMGMHRHNWLEAHVLRQEAETKLRWSWGFQVPPERGPCFEPALARFLNTGSKRCPPSVQLPSRDPRTRTSSQPVPPHKTTLTLSNGPKTGQNPLWHTCCQ